MFRKVLIANRGEIAVRVIRACRDLGVIPAVVYSEADRTSLHVRLADEAYLLGPSPAAESYLDIAKVIDAAKSAHADAIHPGYGFLSENADFAAACSNAGIAFIGPSAESIRLLGNKTAARTLLQKNGIPTAPEAIQALASVEKARTPLVNDFQSMQQGNSGSRHIEIQIFADRRGNAIYLGERECSLQRRNHKLLEESPSPFLNDELRGKLGEMAVRVARTFHYENAGAVEFLVDERGQCCFLEMSARLQAAHPVTEVATGVDMVCEQIRVASGEPLSLRQEQIQARGWAIECCICAEDPDNGLLPPSGIIRRLQEPQGPGIRLDSGVYQGWGVSIHYDPLLAKLISFGKDRMQAIARMQRAIQEYRIEGIRTNLALFSEIISSAEFLAGNAQIALFDAASKRGKETQAPSLSTIDAHALAAALAYADATDPSFSPEDQEAASAWKLSGRFGFSTGRK